MIKSILVPTDGSEHAEKAINFAADLAEKYQASIILLHVVSKEADWRVQEFMREFEKIEHVHITERDVLGAAAADILKKSEEILKKRGISDFTTAVEEGRPAKVILSAAKDRGADLIVMGSRGLGDAQSLLLGSVSHTVCHLSDCTCISVK